MPANLRHAWRYLSLLALFGCSERESAGNSKQPRETYTVIKEVSFESIGTDARDVVPTASATYWVLTDHEPFLTEIDGTGKVLRRIGRRGRGPTDLLAPWSLVRDRDDESIWVYDAGRHEIVDVNSLSADPVTIPLRVSNGPIRDDIRKVTHGDVSRVWKSSAGILALSFPGELSVGRHLLFPSILRYTTEGFAADTLVNFRTSPPDTSGLGDARELVPIPLWIACESKLMFLYDGYSAKIELLSPNGSRRPIGDVGIPKLQTTEADYRQYLLGQLRDEYGESKSAVELEALASRLARSGRTRASPMLPSVARLRCGPSGSVLIQRYDLTHDNVGYSRDWLILTPPDSIPRNLSLPLGFDPRFAIGDTLVGLLQDELGRVNLAFAVDSQSTTP